MKLPNRMIILLSLLQELGDRVTSKNVNQLLFLYCHKYTKNEAYHFILVSGLQHSIQLYEDQKFLQTKGLLHELELTPTAPRYAIKLDMFDKFGLQKLKNDLDNKAIEDITTTWNEYFIFQDQGAHPTLYTIGYEGLSLDQYIGTLLKNRVVCLCDVRRNPYSQKYGFSKAGLKEFLEFVGIKYVHIPELGIDSSLRSDLNNEMDYYKLLTKYETEMLPKRSSNIEDLKKLLEQHQRVAITCFEANVKQCHRSKIGNLMRSKYEVRDI